MAVETRQLRIKARKLGATDVREMSRDELEDYIAEHSSKKNGKKNKVKAGNVTKAKKAVKAKRGPGRPKGSKNRTRDEIDDDEDEAPKRRGRPPGSKNKTSTKKSGRGPGRPPKAESERKQTRKKKGSVGRPPGSGSGTRVAVPENIKWGRDFDFREGSTAQYILNQLRKSAEKYEDTADIREHTFEKLAPKINKVDELTFQNRAAGKPHKGEAAETMLRYRINRTIFDYCVETGQHEGSNGNGSTKTKTKKRGPGRPPKSETAGKNKVKKRGRPRKVADDDDEDDDEDEAPKKRGRPKGSKNKSTKVIKKRGPGRPKGSKNRPKDDEDEDDAPRKRGRPKGSKNKVTSGKVKKRGPGRPKGSKNKKSRA